MVAHVALKISESARLVLSVEFNLIPTENVKKQERKISGVEPAFEVDEDIRENVLKSVLVV